MDRNLFNYLFGTDAASLPGNIILTPFFSTKRFEAYCEIVSSFKGSLYSGSLCRAGSGDFAVIRCGMGAGIAGDCVLALKDTTASDLVFIGSAGGLNGVGIGDIVAVGKACNAESFSTYYDSAKSFTRLVRDAHRVESSRSLTGKTVEKLTEHARGGEIVKRGDVFTTGSLFCETETNIRELERAGFSAIEMELSAVMTAARVIRIKSAAALFISDEPLLKPLWREMEKEEKNKYDHSIDVIIKSVIDLFSRK